MENLEHLKIMAVSWNMGSVSPTNEVLDQLLMKDAVLHDLYVVAT